MGFRFHKSIKIAPGIRLNLNKKSTSVSIGGKGARYTVSSNGRKTATVGLPGTGLSYSVTKPSGKQPSKAPKKKSHWLDGQKKRASAEPLPQPERQTHWFGGRKKRAAAEPQPEPEPQAYSQESGRKKTGCLTLLLALIFWPFALSYWLWKTDKWQAGKKARAAIIAALWIGMFGMMGSLGGSGTQAQIAAASAVETPQPTQWSPQFRCRRKPRCLRPRQHRLHLLRQNRPRRPQQPLPQHRPRNPPRFPQKRPRLRRQRVQRMTSRVRCTLQAAARARSITARPAAAE